MRGGDRGPAVIPGNGKGSLLYQAISHAGKLRMPLNADKLPDNAIARVAEWIDQGARYDAPVAVSSKGAEKPLVDHWAFKIPQRPAVPAVRNPAWARNPVDAFVAAEYEKRGLEPVAAADKRTLLRRVYLDLTGLPPTPKEVADFLADRSEDAYERVVDRLLASPRYGEQWGRHWMDIWRYSDWYGIRYANLVRYSERHVWRWRDWIVESLNQDKGYNRMITEMLAGDEIAPTDPAVLRATGYLVRNKNPERNIGLQETIDHTAAGFLGITLKCARCHDHKFDPFLQSEYYRFRAFFEPMAVRIDRMEGQPDTLLDGVARVYDAKADAPTYRFIRGDYMNPEKDKPLEPGVPSIMGNTALKIEPVQLPLRAYYPDSRATVQDDLVAGKRTEIAKAEAALAKAKAHYEEVKNGAAVSAAPRSSDSHPAAAGEPGETHSPAGKADQPEIEKAMVAVTLAEKELEAARAELPALEARVAADRARFKTTPDPKAEELAVTAREAERPALLLRAESEIERASQKITAAKSLIPSDLVKSESAVEQATTRLKAALEAIKYRPDYTSVGTINPTTSTGRRTALARWITDGKNPLTARVAVNHIWLRHFGQAIVPSVYDFGLNGKPPSHPQLLDWLAVEFQETNWSMKRLHRLLVTSNTYRLASSTPPDSSDAKLDPENVYLWRMNARRMSGENVRDSVLAVSGKLDTRMGGPELDEAEGQTSFRRSLYFRHTPEEEMVFLKVFDAANPNECYRRNESVVPQQALALANSDLSWSQARVVATRLAESGVDDAGFVDQAFELILARPPGAAERDESRRFLHDQAALLKNPEKLTPFSSGGDGRPSPPVPANWERGSGIIQKGGRTLTDVYPRWTEDALAGKCVTIQQETYRIESNTSIVLTIKGAWKLESGEEYPYRLAACSAEFVAEEARVQAARGSNPSSDPSARAREGLIHALFNHNEFVTIR